jgi:hypothetical protein
MAAAKTISQRRRRVRRLQRKLEALSQLDLFALMSEETKTAIAKLKKELATVVPEVELWRTAYREAQAAEVA